MRTTLVALFTDYTQAQHAYDRLQAVGIGRQTMQLNSDAAETPQAAEARSGRDQAPGAIRRFFSELFGSDDKSGASNYAEAARRGDAVLTVAVEDEGRIGEISDILNECGAVDVDDRARAWHAQGDAPGGDYADLRMDSWTGRQGGVRMHQRTSEVAVAAQPLVHEERRGVEHISEGDSLIHAAPARYAGPERRVRNDPSYLGAERRMAA